MDRALMVVLVSLVVILILLGTLLVYIVARKAVENKQARRLEQLQEHYQLPLLRYLKDGAFTRLLVPEGREKTEALENLLALYAGVLRGEETNGRIAEYTELYWSERFRRRLRSRSWSVRMNTLYRIDLFRMRSLEQELLTRLNAGGLTNPEQVETFRILSSFGTKELVGQLLQSDADFSDFHCRSIVNRMDEQTFAEAMERFAELPRRWQLSLLDVIGVQRRVERLPFLEELLKGGDIELRTRSLKAMSQFSLLLPKEEYLRHADSDDWQERVMAARLFGAVRSAVYVRVLQRLMRDPSWWVRSQAAQSLLEYPEGRLLLERIVEGDEDSFARDMALEWLEKEETRGFIS
ncbi:hypothetical protein J31TS4_02540 [Paenibacillus sp. J31TS4]|uniref:HEAT repeat domain-containing protein n=1 Tax=Paenibacillus sp. J31TS4 TaxID=2807195 RepID=UPI001B077FBE|nr:HEAT repeat domain-containing protein [Paenibacillus sp. J31TS4]GIP36974.1 hypothetical protein J31TS4_02540 [Paenibacillus sp. J31TS4]